MPSHASTSPTFPLYKLPTELISYIYDSLPLFPLRQRQTTLANLCLVDKFSLELARPILYRELRLTINCRVSSSLYLLTRTLKDEGSTCRKRVKSLIVSFTIPTPDSLGAFYALLEHVELEKIRMKWIFGGGGWMERETKELIEKKQPKLKSFQTEESLFDRKWTCW
ncbi:hypothetical protein JCM5350_000545 [Sporobolomyces pararoseus]